MAKMIVVDERRCLGCKSCELACAMAHSEAASLVEALLAESRPQSRIHVEPLEAPAPQGALLEAGCMPMQCRHCEDAPCMAVCPSGAIYRPETGGPVLLDPQRCIGCKFCIVACPFGVIALSRDGKAVVKCDRCRERLAGGELPACVDACPTGALEYRDLDEWLAERRREAAGRVAKAQAVGEDAARM